MKLKVWHGAAVITLLSIAMAVYASFLNQIFYTRYAPFFDSNSYQMTLLNVLAVSKENGLLPALSFAATRTGTVTLPFIQAVLMSPWIENPVRHITPFIILPWLLCFSLSLYIYFHRFLNQGFWMAITLTLPFISIFAFWFYNGGIVDFRMDILQYLLLSTAFIWYLASRYTTSYLSWVLMGLFLGLACLARATTPVFAILCLVPLILVRIIFYSQRRRQTIIGSLLAILTCSIVAAWFFIVNYSDLYHYYAVWNIDANASLPLSRSVQHLGFAFRNIGHYALTASLILFFTRLFIHFRRQHNPEYGLSSFIPSSTSFFRYNVDWESLWLGSAPILFLVLRGAGLNPFVSMPAMFGIIMFLVSPGGVSQQQKLPIKPIFTEQSNVSFISYIVIFSIFSASTLSGLDHHVHPNQGRLFRAMAPQQSIIETIAQDAAARNVSETVYMSTTFLTSLNNSSLRNILAFDYHPQASPQRRNEWISKLQLPPASYPAQTFNRVQSPSDWATVAGTTDQEKIAFLVDVANQSLDYAILPTEESFPVIGRINPHVIVNRYAEEIKTQLLETGSWTVISDSIQVDNSQFIRIYRNDAISR